MTNSKNLCKKKIGLPSWASLVIHFLYYGLIVAVIALAFLCVASAISGCSFFLRESPRPKCQVLGEYRCNQNTLEICDGEAWSPRFDCGTELNCFSGEWGVGCYE